MLACLRAAEVADGIHLVSTLEEVRRDLDDIGEHLSTDTLVGRTAGGAIAAFGSVFVRPGSTRDRRAELWGEIHPDHRDGRLEGFVLDWMIRRGEERLAGLPSDLPRFLEVQAYDHLAERRRALEERGFIAARWWSDMGRDLAGALPEAGLPAGIELAPWDPARRDEVRLVHNAAFRDHFGTNPLSAEQWDRWMVGSSAFRPDLSVLAVAAGGEIAGYATSYVYPDDFPAKGRTEAWIGQLGVAAEWRRQGVATALVAACLAAYAAEGLEFGALMVDSENATGAVGLYGRLDFVVEHRWITYRRDFRPVS